MPLAGHIGLPSGSWATNWEHCPLRQVLPFRQDTNLGPPPIWGTATLGGGAVQLGLGAQPPRLEPHSPGIRSGSPRLEPCVLDWGTAAQARAPARGSWGPAWDQSGRPGWGDGCRLASRGPWGSQLGGQDSQVAPEGSEGIRPGSGGPWTPHPEPQPSRVGVRASFQHQGARTPGDPGGGIRSPAGDQGP